MDSMDIEIIGNGLPAHLALSKIYKNNNIKWDYEESNFELPMSSTLDLIPFLMDNIKFEWTDLENFNGNIKTGVKKVNFNNNTFYSNFQAPYVALHFDTLSMSNYLYNRCNYTPTNDSIFTINTNKPSSFDTYKLLEHVPTNCAVGYKFKENNSITHTTIEASEFGWIQTIPTKDYLYVYYIFNKDINSPEEIADTLPLKNYPYKIIDFDSFYYQDPFQEKELKLGLNCFFIEPFDATSISGNLRILDLYDDLSKKLISKDYALYLYYDYIKECMEVLMMHYISDVPFDTEFWKLAKEKAEDYFNSKGLTKRDVSNFYSEKGYEKLYKNLGISSYIQSLQCN
jgi:hypothetical protein